MRDQVKSETQVQSAPQPTVPPTTQAPFTYKYLSESALLRAMFAHDFAKKICKVRNFAYLCIGKRCNKQQYSIHTKPHYSGVPETLSYLLRYCTFAKTQGASLLLYTYIN